MSSSADREGASLTGRELSLQREDDLLSSLLPDARHRGESVQVVPVQGLGELLAVHAGKHLQRSAGTDPFNLLQVEEERALRLVGKPVQPHCIVPVDKVRVDPGNLAHGRKLFQGFPRSRELPLHSSGLTGTAARRP